MDCYDLENALTNEQIATEAADEIERLQRKLSVVLPTYDYDMDPCECRDELLRQWSALEPNSGQKP